MMSALRAQRARLIPIALLIVAAALRFYRLADADLWWDEALAVWAVRKPLLAATDWTASDVHPPLFFWLLWAWRRLAGESELALRAMVAYQGVALAAVAYAIGRLVGGRRAGAWALALAAVSPFLVWWSQELRMYTTAALALALAAYAACRWAADPGGPGARRALTCYAAAAAATLYSVYLAGAGLAALALAVLVYAARRRIAVLAVRDWLVANAAACALFTPWALYAGGRMSSWRTVAEGAAPGFAAELWAALLAHGTSTDIAGVRWATGAFWACAALAAAVDFVRRGSDGQGASYRRSDRHQRPIGLLVALLIVPPAVVWLATQPRSLFYSPSIEARYFVPFAAPVYALVGVWLGRATRATSAARLAWLAGVGSLVVAMAFLPGHFGDRRRTATLDAMALAIWSQAEPDDVVLLVSGNRYPLFLYHFERQWVQPAGRPRFEFPADRPPDPGDRPRVVPFPDRGSGTLPDGWQDDLDALVAGHERVWLVAYGRDLQDPGGQVEAWLDGRLHRVLSEGYGPDALHLFARQERPPGVTALSSRWPGTLWLGSMIESVGATGTWLPLGALPTRRAAAGDSLELTLFSTGDERPGPQRAWLHAWLGRREHIEARAGPLFPYIDAGAEGEVRPAADGQAAEEAGASRRATGPQTSLGAPVLRHRFTLPVDARTPGGNYGLTVRGPDGRSGSSGLPVQVVDAYPPVRGRSRMANAVVAGYVLEGAYAASDRLRPGQPLILDLVWAPLTIDPPIAPNPTVFAHLVGPPRPDGSGTVWAVDDGPPSVGGWELRSDYYFDRHILTVPSDAPPGVYTIEVGMYDPETGERYGVDGSLYDVDVVGKRLKLGTVQVR